MIFYISPWTTAKPLNIGGNINATIRRLRPDDTDWIVLTDPDTLWLLHDSKTQLESILTNTDRDIIGPVTNRLAMPHQLVTGMFDVDSITTHIEVASSLQERDYATVIPTTDILAAFCLCFRISAWKKIGGFHINTISFDTMFSLEAVQLGLKMGIATGVYLLHLYRYQSDNPKCDIRHLV